MPVKTLLTGNGGADVITGGAGADAITAGAGADTIVAGVTGTSVASNTQTFAGDNFAANDSVTFANGVDTITDFKHATGGVANHLVKAAGNTTDVAALTNMVADSAELAKTVHFDDADGAYIAYGSYNTSNSVFTLKAAFNATNANDAIFVFGESGSEKDITDSTGLTVLLDLTAALAVGDVMQA